MSELIIKNIKTEVTKGEKDSAVGISLAHLAGTAEFSLYCTEILANERVGAHYHENGTEFYQIISGQGNIYVGQPSDDKSVNWDVPKQVKTGDFFMIDQKQVHQLHNTSDEKLVVVFGCAKAHITTDRVIVDGYSNTNLN